MGKRIFAACAVSAGMSLVLAVAPVTGQQTASQAERAKPDGRKSWTPPRTPWGDPDLQGHFTNKYEQSTPMERPREFEGRRVEDVAGAELADLLARREREVIDRPAGVGPLQFRDTLEVRKASRAWLLIDPPDGKIPALTPEARQRIGPYHPEVEGGIQGILNSRQRTPSSFGNGPFNGPEDLTLWERCITRGLPGSMMPHILGNSYQIVQSPGFVAIRYELVHDTRVIPLDGRPHLGKTFELELGDARGRWDGDTLVVETTNFRDRSAYRNANASTLRLIERFTRTAPDRIEWAVTVDDATTWTRPWTFSMPLTMNASEPVLEFACHEGNYSVPHILSGRREVESAK